MVGIFDAIPQKLPDELTEVLLSGRDFRLERIVSRGHVTPEDQVYDQSWHEWVLLLSGAARLWVDAHDGAAEHEVELAAGDYLLLPAHCKHRVTWTQPQAETVWLALFFRPE